MISSALPSSVVAVSGNSTRRMLAPGAISWASSTSAVVSPAALTSVGLPGSNGGTGPSGRRIWNDGGAGSPKALSKTVRSLRMAGDP
jgi:hypothetical protein